MTFCPLRHLDSVSRCLLESCVDHIHYSQYSEFSVIKYKIRISSYSYQIDIVKADSARNSCLKYMCLYCCVADYDKIWWWRQQLKYADSINNIIQLNVDSLFPNLAAHKSNSWTLLKNIRHCRLTMTSKVLFITYSCYIYLYVA